MLYIYISDQHSFQYIANVKLTKLCYFDIGLKKKRQPLKLNPLSIKVFEYKRRLSLRLNIPKSPFESCITF